jgi:hypothetical protein
MLTSGESQTKPGSTCQAAAQQMMPYSLALNGSSDNFYRILRDFADEVTGEAERHLGVTVGEFRSFIAEHHLEELRSPEEYWLELLSFGLLWNSYGGYALRVRRAPFISMARMAEWRKRNQRWKPVIDLTRGFLTTFLLLPPEGSKGPGRRPTLRDVDRLCLWLEATGEFREQALRFVRWRAFWETLPQEQLTSMSAAMFDFTGWFVHRSEQVFAPYTHNVEAFRTSRLAHYRWREDRIQCSRPRPEYHFNMVGAEIMNRSFRSDFLHTDATAVLVPGCMRAHEGDQCKAERTPEGLRCTGCEPSCRVNGLRVGGERKGFAVFVIPHASDLRRWSPQAGKPRVGVIASACVTTLVEGGWELKRYDVPAQCVLLDGSGCRKHWDPAGTPTKFNRAEFDRVLTRPC